MRIIFCLLFVCFCGLTQKVNAKWIQKATIPGAVRGYILSTSANGCIYVGGGRHKNGKSSNDFWVYNTVKDIWVRKGNIPGSCHNRSYGVAFTINDKVYFGLGGENVFMPKHRKGFYDLWEYDPKTDIWTEKAKYPGKGCISTSYFVIDNKAYVVGGVGKEKSNETWEYNPEYDKWTKKAHIPYTSLNIGTGFSINGRGYVLGGLNWSSSMCSKRLYEYNPSTDKWIKKSDYPYEHGLCAGVSLVIDGKAYVGLGNNKNLFDSDLNYFSVYDPILDIWEDTKHNFPGKKRGFCVAEIISGKAYIGLGWSDFSGSRMVFNDFYEYDFCSTDNTIREDSLSVICNNGFIVLHMTYISDVQCTVYNGNEIKYKKVARNPSYFDIKHLPSGSYDVEIKSSKHNYKGKIFVSDYTEKKHQEHDSLIRMIDNKKISIDRLFGD